MANEEPEMTGEEPEEENSLLSLVKLLEQATRHLSIGETPQNIQKAGAYVLLAVVEGLTAIAEELSYARKTRGTLGSRPPATGDVRIFNCLNCGGEIGEGETEFIFMRSKDGEYRWTCSRCASTIP